jgi:hypothetical protein
MPISSTRRRLLALGAVALGASVGAARAKTKNTELPGWSFEWDEKVPIAVADGTAVHYDSNRVNKNSVTIVISPKFGVRYEGGVYRVLMRLYGDVVIPEAALAVVADGIRVRILIDGAEVDRVDVPTRSRVTFPIVRDLTSFFGADLGKLAAGRRITVFFDGAGSTVQTYDAVLADPALALAALKTKAAEGPPANGGFGGVPCFLTGACCDAIGLPDDCAELTILRRFRDEVMMVTPDGKEDVASYYRLAPAILAEIARRGEAGALRRLYFTDIVPSVVAARLGLNRLARGLYTRMMRRLARRYGVGA